MSVSIVEVLDKKSLKKFIDFPHDLYDADPYYVPQLYVAAEEILDKKKNPFFKHSEGRYWIAKKDGQVVGRIAAIVNNSYNDYHNSNVGFFGFFDSINDEIVSSSLFSEAERYLRSRGISQIIGPTNFTTNETAGLLIDGYDDPPIVEMTYNYPYYEELIEAFGFTKEMDLYAYFIATKTVNNKALNLLGKLEARLNDRGFSFRNINMKDFKAEVKMIKGLYQKAWEKNWGFVPPTEEEFDAIAEGLKLIVDPKYTFIAEQNGKPIAFAIALPNINKILINIKRGRLLPTGIFKLLWGRRKYDAVRINLLGVVESYRGKGIEAVFFAKFIEQAKKDNLRGGEASWILENNDMMIKAAEKLNGKRYKTYRIFSKDI